MRRIISRAGLWAALCETIFLGCESAARRPYADDPLLLDKKPLAAKAETARPNALARTDPVPPPAPPVALASAPAPAVTKPPADAAEPPPPPPRKVAMDVPAVEEHKPPVQAVPVARTKPPAEPVPTPPIRRQVPETYGHAGDYGWLQGVLDRHHDGHFELRYCDPAVEDKWGGKVVLADDPRLAQFKDGDLILVEGELASDKAVSGLRRHYPVYRVQDIWLAQRGGGKN